MKSIKRFKGQFLNELRVSFNNIQKSFLIRNMLKITYKIIKIFICKKNNSMFHCNFSIEYDHENIVQFFKIFGKTQLFFLNRTQRFYGKCWKIVKHRKIFKVRLAIFQYYYESVKVPFSLMYVFRLRVFLLHLTLKTASTK